MATLLEIKQAAANYLNIDIVDLTQNGQDLFLSAANQVRKMAELANDFEFSRKLVSLTVNGTTGGSLTTALDQDNNLVEVKTVIEAGLLDNGGNLRPIEWTTTAESLTRIREDNMGAWPRYPEDDWARETPFGGARFTFSGDRVTKWPRLSDTDDTDYALKLEAYVFDTDWTAANLATDKVVVTGSIVPNLIGDFNYIGLDSEGHKVWAGGTVPGLLRYIPGAWILYESSNTDGFAFSAAYTTNPSGTYASDSGGATGAPVVTLTTGTSNVWTTHGQKYILWATIVQLNHLWKRFVPRTEGNLPPPQQLADEGLQALIQWDAYKYEGFRTHNR